MQWHLCTDNHTTENSIWSLPAHKGFVIAMQIPETMSNQNIWLVLGPKRSVKLHMEFRVRLQCQVLLLVVISVRIQTKSTKISIRLKMGSPLLNSSNPSHPSDHRQLKSFSKAMHGGFQTEKTGQRTTGHFSSENELQKAAVGLLLKPWHRKQMWEGSVTESAWKGAQINKSGGSGIQKVQQNAFKVSPVPSKSHVDELKCGNAWTKAWRDASSLIHFCTVAVQPVHVLCH